MNRKKKQKQQESKNEMLCLLRDILNAIKWVLEFVVLIIAVRQCQT